MRYDTEIAIVGAGLSGLLASIALATKASGDERSVMLIDAAPLDRASTDGRATTLTPSAMRMLARLGIETPPAEPMTAMRVGEGEADTPWQFELPERADQPLAYVVENGPLRDALLARLEALEIALRAPVSVTDMDMSGRATLLLSDGSEICADLIIAADGRDSTIRRLAGLSMSRLEFGQSALVTTVIHDEPHEGFALQRFQPVGAVASLPLPATEAGHRSQIIWSDRREAITAACNLPETALIELIDERLWHALDVRGLDGPVQSYPLIGRRTETLTQGRVALIGDAARTIHPLAGQGFNLAIRDIAALVDCIAEAEQTGQDIGLAGLLGYARWRAADETLLTGLTTALARAPARGPLGFVGHMRRLAFAAVDEIPLLHPFIRQEAAAEMGDRPSLLC